MPRSLVVVLAVVLPALVVGGAVWAGGRDGAEPPAPPAVAAPATTASATPPPPPEPTAAERRLAERRRLQAGIAWRRSTAVGTPSSGRLVDGVLLPREGVDFFTWDPVRWRRGSPPERRHGTDRLLRTVLAVARAHRAANPGAPRLAIGDIARPGGGDFSAPPTASEFGPRPAVGHASHQNGLDVDLYYPRRDRRERAPDGPEDVHRRLAQDLVDRFVAAGAQFVFVGPRTGLTGPPGVVQVLTRHDGHLHVRLPPG